MAQSVKQLTVDFSSVHDLWVGRLSPMLGSMMSTKPTWESFCPSSSAPPHPSHMLSLSFSLKVTTTSSLRRSQVPSHYTRYRP